MNSCSYASTLYHVPEGFVCMVTDYQIFPYFGLELCCTVDSVPLYSLSTANAFIG